MASLVHGLVKREALSRLEAHKTKSALRQNLAHMRGENHGGRHGSKEAAFAELHHGARLKAFAGLHKALPHAPRRIEVLAAIGKKDLTGTARHRLVADKTRRQHASLVDNEQVALVEEVHDVGKHMVFQRALLTVKHKQAARVAGLGRILGDKLAGKVVIKIVGTHIHNSHAGRRDRGSLAPISLAAWAKTRASGESTCMHVRGRAAACALPVPDSAQGQPRRQKNGIRSSSADTVPVPWRASWPGGTADGNPAKRQ